MIILNVACARQCYALVILFHLYDIFSKKPINDPTDQLNVNKRGGLNERRDLKIVLDQKWLSVITNYGDCSAKYGSGREYFTSQVSWLAS